MALSNGWFRDPINLPFLSSLRFQKWRTWTIVLYGSTRHCWAFSEVHDPCETGQVHQLALQRHVPIFNTGTWKYSQFFPRLAGSGAAATYCTAQDQRAHGKIPPSMRIFCCACTEILSIKSITRTLSSKRLTNQNFQLTFVCCLFGGSSCWDRLAHIPRPPYMNCRSAVRAF